MDAVTMGSRSPIPPDSLRRSGTVAAPIPADSLLAALPPIPAGHRRAGIHVEPAVYAMDGSAVAFRWTTWDAPAGRSLAG